MKKDPSSSRISARLLSGADEQAADAALDWATSSGVTDRIVDELQVELRRGHRRRIRRVSGAVAALCFVGGVAWNVFAPDRSNPSAAASVRSNAVVVLPVKQILPDGSVVELKEGAEIALAFTPSLRGVTLLRGEAHFQVVKDPARPFIVHAGGVEARAVGTAFSVDLGSAEVEVLVTEGRVAVEQTLSSAAASSVPTSVAEDPITSGSAAVAPAAIVEAGNRVIVERSRRAPRPAVEAVSGIDLAEKLAWRVPRLQFSGTPLAEVIALFNQHSGARLVLGEPALGSLQLSGVLRADNIDSLLRLLELEFGIEADKAAGGATVLHRRR